MGWFDGFRSWFTDRFHRARTEATAKATEAATAAVVAQGPALAKRALSAAGARFADEFVGFAERELARATAERGLRSDDGAPEGFVRGPHPEASDPTDVVGSDGATDSPRPLAAPVERAVDREARARDELARLKAERARRDAGSPKG